MNMPKRGLITLIVGLLLCACATAQGSGEATLELVRDGGQVEMRFAMGRCATFFVDDSTLGLRADGLANLADKAGLPALPVMSRVVTLPKGATLRLAGDVLTDSSITLSLPKSLNNNIITLQPYAGATVKDEEPQRVEPDKKAYSRDAFTRGGEAVAVRHLGTMGDREVYRVEVRPVEYNPVLCSLRVGMAIRARLEVKDGGGVSGGDAPRRFLIVSRPQFREGLKPFVQWKRQEGYEVVELYADTNRREAVKAMIAPLFIGRAEEWPQYMLIVGDAAQIQSYLGTTYPSGLNNHTTDLYYTEHTGDYLPDALLGRWPVNDTAELAAVVEKTLRYERCTGLDTNRLNRALLVAGREGSNPAPVTTNGQVNYAKRELKGRMPRVDTVCYHNPASGDQREAILADIRTGAALLNYTAHCSVGGWTNPSVSYASVDTLDEGQPMLWVNNCCKSNAFDGTGFGEQLLRKPVGGAIGVIGATNSTLWNEDYYWSVGPKYPFSLEPLYDSLHQGAFDRWLGGEALTQGAMLAAGNMAVTAFGSPYDKFYWEIYCLLGDPSLRPYIGTPQRIQLWVPDTLTVGATELRVSGTQGATVSAVQGGTLLCTVTLDDHRSTLMRMRQPVDTLPIIFTASGANMVPVVDTVHTAMPVVPTVTFRDVTVSDTVVSLTLVNLGADTLRDVAVQLLCDDTTLALFDALPGFADTLLPHAAIPMHISLSVWQWAERWSGMLHAYSTTGIVECQALHLSGWLDGVPPSLHVRLLDPDSNDAPLLSAGSEYLFQAWVDGLCDTASLTVTTLPIITTHFPLTTNHYPLTTPDTLTHLHLEGMAGNGRCRRNYDLWMVAGERMDSFEEGMDSYPWDTTSMRPWRVDSTASHSGRLSLRSAPIDYRQTSDLGLTLTLPRQDSLSFWVRVSSEESYDRLLFSIDGVKRLDISGETGWTRRAYTLDEGTHTLRWRYMKDESGNSGSDCAWLDDVHLPLALWDSAYGWFGTMAGLSVEEAAATPAVTIAPSPTADAVRVACDIPAEVEIADISGRRLATLHLKAGQPQRVSLAGLPAGVYMAIVRTGATTVCEKIIKL